MRHTWSFMACSIVMPAIGMMSKFGAGTCQGLVHIANAFLHLCAYASFLVIDPDRCISSPSSDEPAGGWE